MNKRFIATSTEKDQKMMEEAIKELPNHEWLNEPCNKHFKNGDIVIVSVSGIDGNPIKTSFQQNHGRVGEVIYAGNKSITIKYVPNPNPDGFGVAGSWTESFMAFDLAQGKVRKYDDK